MAERAIFAVPPNFGELPEDEQRAIAEQIHRQMVEALDTDDDE